MICDRRSHRRPRAQGPCLFCRHPRKSSWNPPQLNREHSTYAEVNNPTLTPLMWDLPRTECDNRAVRLLIHRSS